MQASAQEQNYLVNLREVLTSRFNEGELRTLCFDLRIEYDNLPGTGNADKARELVAHCYRHNSIPKLVEVGRQQRPDIDWDKLPHIPSSMVTASVASVVTATPTTAFSQPQRPETPSPDRQRVVPFSKSPHRGTFYALVGGFISVTLVVLGILYVTRPSQKSITCDQPIRTATATIEITVVSDEGINTTYMDRGAYAAFGKDNESLLIMASSQCTAKQMGGGKVVYRAVANMDVSDVAFGKPMRILEKAGYIQIGFIPMPAQSRVLTGKITCIFNGGTVLEIGIPAQVTTDGKIFVRGLGLNCGAS